MQCEECCTKIYHRSRREIGCSANSSSLFSFMLLHKSVFVVVIVLALFFIIALSGVPPSNSALVLLFHYFHSPALAYYEQALGSCLLAQDTFLDFCRGK